MFRKRHFLTSALKKWCFHLLCLLVLCKGYSYITIMIRCASVMFLSTRASAARTAFNFCCDGWHSVPKDRLDRPDDDFGIIIGITIPAKIFKSCYFRTCYSPRRSHHLCLLLTLSIPCGPKPFPNTGRRSANRLMRDLSTSLPFDSRTPAPLLPRISIVFVRSEIIIHLYVLECGARKLQSL